MLGYFLIKSTKNIEKDELNDRDLVRLSKMVTDIREQMLYENSTKLYNSQLYFEAVEALERFEKFEETGVVEPGEAITFESSFGQPATFTKEAVTTIKENIDKNIRPLDIKIALINNLYNNGTFDYSENQLDTLLDGLGYERFNT